MYHAEVLSKFPVVQHFYFGALYKWARDPHAASATGTIHMASTSKAHAPSSIPETSMPIRAPPHTGAQQQKDLIPAPSTKPDGTKAPWAGVPGMAAEGVTREPWAMGGSGQSARAPLKNASASMSDVMRSAIKNVAKKPNDTPNDS